MVGKVIYNLLSNSAELTSLIGNKIFPSVSINEKAVNYIVYQKNGTSPTDCKNSRSTFDILSYEILIYSEKLETLNSIFLAVRNTLDQYSGVNSGLTIERIIFQDADDDFDETSKIYEKTVNFEVRYKNIYSTLGQPTNFATTPNGATQIDLSWTDNATGETGYKIYRSTNLTAWALIDTIAANSTSYSDTVTTETQYYYYVVAYNSDGNGYASEVIGGIAYASGGVTPSGIAYQHPQQTFQTVSYRVGDAAWIEANNPYPTNPTNPLYTAELVDTYTLVNNNVFGNTYRFTDQTGNVAILNNVSAPSTTDTIIDHYTGIEWGYNNYQIGNNKNWNTAIDECLALNVQGFDDWYLPTVNEWLSLLEINGSFYNVNNVIFVGNRNFWCGETDYNDTTRGLFFSSTSSMSSVVSRTLKTTNYNYIPVRRRY
jgi:hypothetical protein